MNTATATAHPNIALVKYWGKRDVALNLPAVSSLSLTLDTFRTETTVTWGAERDSLELDGRPATDKELARVVRFLDRLGEREPCRVVSANNFPTAAGLASSSSGFAALALAAATAAGRALSPEQLSVLARMGSGSASRSLWGGFVRWQLGEQPDGSDSHGIPVAPADHWDVAMVVAVVSGAKKSVGSTEGMERSRHTSPYYQAWVDTAEAQVDEGQAAVLARDLPRLGEVMEASTLQMHSVMHTSRPPIVYWAGRTLDCWHAVAELRRQGIGAWATMDAGPNVKVLCEGRDAEYVARVR